MPRDSRKQGQNRPRANKKCISAPSIGFHYRAHPGAFLCVWALAVLGLFPVWAGACEGYPARLVRVVDGDTILLDIELGLGVVLARQPVRFAGLDAPERNNPEGQAATVALRNFLSGKTLRVEVRGKEKYGRWLGVVYADGESVNEWLVKNGWAVKR